MDPIRPSIDSDLRTRMVALEAHAPVNEGPPPLTRAARRGRLVRSASMVTVLVVAMAATAMAGAAVVVTNLAHGYEGVENPGQPLAGANMECMTPPQAAAFLAGRGYTGVVWQVESGDPSANGKGTTSVLQSTPPAHGFVVPGAILGDGHLHMVIDQQSGARGAGDCLGQSMP